MHSLQEMFRGFQAQEVPSNFLHMFYVKTNLDMKAEDGTAYPKVNFIFAVKQENRGKLDSMRWIMRGIWKVLQPEFYLMVDTGSKPLPKCSLNLALYLEFQPKCMACNAERYVDTRGWLNTWTFWESVSAMFQSLDYKGILVTYPSDSFFGY